MPGLFRRLRAWFDFPTPQPGGHRAETGHTPALQPGLRIYAIGDIHGERELLDALTRRIEADLVERPVETARAVFLGDYIDRGPASRDVIARLAARDFPLPFEALRGNHEDLMLRAMEDIEVMVHWCETGAPATLRSYGLDVEARPRAKALAMLRSEFVEALPPAHLEFIRSTRLSWTTGSYFFVHAGARPGIALDRQDEQDLMWIRDACYSSSFDFGKVLVHGHTPRKQPEDLPRRINVDTGAFKWGVLSAAVLEGETRRFLSSRS